MALPFTIAEFLGVFRDYNLAIWPVQILAMALGLTCLGAVLVGGRGAPRLALGVVALLWAMTGIGYHLVFFARINPMAPVFGGAFVAQALLLTAGALWPGDPRLAVGRGVEAAFGLAVIAYALAIYPVLGLWAGHGGTAGPMFGVAPCPTTIFTLGVLITARGRWAIWLSIIRVLWSVIGLAAALHLGIPEDLGLPVAGAALVAIRVVTAVRHHRADRAARGA